MTEREKGTLSAESLSPEIQDKVDKLKELQDEHSSIEAKLRAEIEELEKKYLKEFKPLYQKRADIVRGTTNAALASGEVKGIPNFWLRAMKNHFMLASTITSTDELALAHLVDVRFDFLETGKV